MNDLFEEEESLGIEALQKYTPITAVASIARCRSINGITVGSTTDKSPRRDTDKHRLPTEENKRHVTGRSNSGITRKRTVNRTLDNVAAEAIYDDDEDEENISADWNRNRINVDPLIVNNNELSTNEFFITTQAKVSDVEVIGKQNRKEERQTKLKEQKDENYQMQSELRRKNLPQSVELQLKESKMREIQEEFQQKRQFFEDMEATLQLREENLKNQRVELFEKIESMRMHEKQANGQYQKFRRKAEDEAKQNQLLQDQMEDITTEIEGLSDTRQQLEKQLNEMMQFQFYLESVCKTESSFSEIEKIVERYERLMYANNHLKSEIEKSKQETMSINYRVKKEKEDRQNKIFELNSQLVQTRKELDRIQKERRSKEDLFLVQDRLKTRTERLIGNLEMSIRNLSARCDMTRMYKVGRKVKVEEMDPLQQLDIIQLRLLDLLYIKQAASDSMSSKTS